MSRIVDRCPGGCLGDLVLYSDVDGDESGRTWTRYTFVCEVCEKHLEARLIEGEFQPVSDQDDEAEVQLS